MFFFFAILAMVITGTLLFLVLFEKGLGYHVTAPQHPLDSKEFLCLAGALSDAQVRRDTTVEVFSTGQSFYDAQIASISQARKSVNVEAYIFRDDATGRRLVDALAERARAGVKVNVIVDAIGSFTSRDSTFDPIRHAGGKVCWYQPIRWYTLKRFNNRTHRELTIVDGTSGFIGGAGIADVWSTGEKGQPPWRDTVVRVTGDLVLGLQATFAENWLESADEILTRDEYFQDCSRQSSDDRAHTPGEIEGFVVTSSPSAGRSTRARILFQTLLASAKQTIHINSPYFLPDPSVRRELIDAVKRGVKVRVIAPGDYADHMMTRRASRRLYGELLQGGVEIHEYQPAMIHAKVLTVDDTWAVVGSTNFDNRSFGINDEVNLAARGPSLVERLEQDFQSDLSKSRPISLEEWQRRSPWEKFMERVGMIIERQQ